MDKSSYVKFETPESLEKSALDLVENSFRNGKIKKGTNEVIKSIERGESKLVVISEDVSPPEVVYYLPTLCTERKVPFVYVKKKNDLGGRVGISSAASISIVDYGKNQELYTKVVEDLNSIKK
ncbi:MAG: 50S ribosomal protein L7Ae [Candidatus Thermoplasmatota archaeon]|nr:50S ribosomal protein L7Ae [Candidatus Thermoplasmatota archaeon]MCL5785178.1 50S ribosomal protein L7Ae [Candidatus Thermoplasmatota archaeon]